jgi:carbamoyl-phosphate synthase large subunit
LRADGYETIMVNCNPETVSTDYDISEEKKNGILVQNSLIVIHFHCRGDV